VVVMEGSGVIMVTFRVVILFSTGCGDVLPLAPFPYFQAASTISGVYI
jgi:hypothetical protein